MEHMRGERRMEPRQIVRRVPTSDCVDLRADPSDALTCTAQRLAGAVCLSVTGELNLATVSSFRQRLRSTLNLTDNLVVDFTALRSIDSTGIHALLDAYQTSVLRGRLMVLVSVPPRIQRVLKAFEVDEIIPIFSVREAAMAAFGGAPLASTS
jgi:anti-anti-sigma factor